MMTKVSSLAGQRIPAMKRSIERRIEQLERNPQFQPPPPPSPENQLFRERAEQLIRQIDQKYAVLISQDLEHDNEFSQWSEFGLTLAFLTHVRDHIRTSTPLAFPAEVAEAYAGRWYSEDAASCLACRYRLPRGYFKLCPVCGGEVRNT